MNNTLKYYQDNAQEFFDSTVNADVSANYDHFLQHIPKHGMILDFGCGSGRDTKAFLQRGFSVEAIDGSSELCKLASEHCGIKVQCMDFMELNVKGKFDGIWACASLLHISKEQMPILLMKMREALVEDGFIYISYKLGDFEGERNGRFFSDFTSSAFRDMFGNVSGLRIIEEWFTEDVRPEKQTEWYNVILKRIVITEGEANK